ncbi:MULTISPECIES: molybdate ABC transporter permease subunit [Sporomusa]|jgi:molybdate transport system permease protein|uniref:Molybdenum transport system permease n=1 Tax=Sporomusa sphaeroides DSM 2875 TaxID=1337886 RepID=A0ABP2CDA5_9FIRM|nr:molybdate ABC transporter permease subunit [Sporomusa sphaeroides]OLS58789.1 molybdenum transport system permease protein ModB [Sporomusa sphaeroides DSM 2875]CVK21354.1 Molybdenum transport system permease protein ModB [Sporomusa sphaeroides DSM 2875]
MEWQPVLLSVKVALVSLIFVFTFGVAAAYAMRSFEFPGKSALEAVFALPLVLPPVVTGFVLLVLIGKQGPIGQFLSETFHTQIIFTPYAAMLAATVVAFPLMYQSTKAAFQGVDRTLEDAARTLGSSEWRVFLTITIPLAWPGLVAGLVLSFARALGEFGATIMVAGNIPGKTQTIPLAIYFAAESNNLTLAGTYVLLISGITFLLIFWLNVWSKKRAGDTSVRGLF